LIIYSIQKRNNRKKRDKASAWKTENSIEDLKNKLLAFLAKMKKFENYKRQQNIMQLRK